MNLSRPRLLPLVALLALAAPLLPAEPLEKLTVERINSDPSLSGTQPTGFQWMPDGKHLSFVRRSAEAASLYALDATKGDESLLLDGSKLKLPGEKPGLLPLARATRPTLPRTPWHPCRRAITPTHAR